MTKYPVKYQSTSKRVDIALEDMHSAHLTNAYKKLTAYLVTHEIDVDQAEHRERATLADCMAAELSARGATVERENVIWPPKPEEIDPEAT